MPSRKQNYFTELKKFAATTKRIFPEMTGIVVGVNMKNRSRVTICQGELKGMQTALRSALGKSDVTVKRTK